MHGKDNKLIDGNARIVDENHTNITVRKSDIDELEKNKSGDFLQFHIKRRYELDKYNNTHVVVSGHYKSKKEIIQAMDETQPENVNNKGKSMLDV
jgi:hypothetical protein